MTSTAIRNEKSVLMEFGSKSVENQRGSKVSDSFSELFNKQTKQNQNVDMTNTDSMAKVQTAIQRNAQNMVKNEQVTNSSEEINSEANELQDEVSDALKELGEDLIKEIAKELNITEDEVREIMEILGIGAADLLQPDNLMMVVMQATGETDSLELVTNEELYSALKNLNDFAREGMEQIQSDFDIPSEQMEDILNRLKNMMSEVAEDTKLTEANAQNDQRTQGTVEIEGQELSQGNAASKDITEQSDIIEEMVQTEEETETGSESKKSEIAYDALETEGTITKDAITQTVSKSETGNAKADNGNEANNAFMQNLNQQNKTQAASNATSQMLHQPSTSEIMDQIMEFMKIQLKPEMSQLEMQLHPESLGTLQIHISSKEGIITAQFRTENETVKTALEGQMVQLKESFEAQGIKIEAIEVEVQSNAYQQEYESSKENGNQEESNKKKGTHKIELHNLEELLEAEMDEEEQIVVSMMKSNGNSVDYKA